MKLKPVTLPNCPKGLRFDALAVTDPRLVIDAQTARIDVFDTIMQETVTTIAAALRQIGGRPITLRLNSLGGDPFAATAAFNLLVGYAGDVSVEILGAAMSAASVLAMAGDKIGIAPSAQLMIHRGTAGAIGVADDLRTLASALDRVDAGMAAIYEARSGLPMAQITAMMDAETYMGATEAVALGFADSVLENSAGVAPPRLAASSAPASKRELEDGLRAMGLSRSAASRAAGAGWAAMRGGAGPDGPDDLPEAVADAIADALASNISALSPPRFHR